MSISKTAIISPEASIGKNVTIKDFSIIEPGVVIKDNCEIHTNVLIQKGTTISSGCRIFHSAVIGAEPQDLKFVGEVTTVEIGENTVIREFATISRGTKARMKTVIGNNCYLMSYSHVPHDTIMGNNIIITNAVTMGGHVTVDDWAIIGGMAGVHQFVHVGEHSFIAACSKVTQDVPPYILAGGTPITYKGLNMVGLKRRGFTDNQLKHIKQTYNYIYNSKYNISDSLKAIKDSIEQTDEVKKIIKFIETSERGIITK